MSGRRLRGVAAATTAPGYAFFLHTEPILPEHGADEAGWGVGEGIAGEEAEDVEIIFEEALLSLRNDGRLLPGGEGGEPEVPVEAWLVRSVDAWAGVHVLRLVEEGIGDPLLAVVGSLKLDLVSMRCHDGEETILVCDAKWLERDDWFQGEGRVAPEHLTDGNEGCVEDPSEDDGGDCGSERGERVWFGLRIGFVVG